MVSQTLGNSRRVRATQLEQPQHQCAYIRPSILQDGLRIERLLASYVLPSHLRIDGAADCSADRCVLVEAFVMSATLGVERARHWWHWWWRGETGHLVLKLPCLRVGVALHSQESEKVSHSNRFFIGMLMPMRDC